MGKLLCVFSKLSQHFANNPTQTAGEKLPSLHVGLQQSHWIFGTPLVGPVLDTLTGGGGDSLDFVVLCDPAASGLQTMAKNSEDS